MHVFARVHVQSPLCLDACVYDTMGSFAQAHACARTPRIYNRHIHSPAKPIRVSGDLARIMSIRGRWVVQASRAYIHRITHVYRYDMYIFIQGRIYLHMYAWQCLIRLLVRSLTGVGQSTTWCLVIVGSWLPTQSETEQRRKCLA
jgi:hypothetical protein